MRYWTVLCFLLTGGIACRPAKPRARAQTSVFSTYETADGRAYCEAMEKIMRSEGFVTGVLELPEDPSVPMGQKIQVYYYHAPFRPGATPVVFFNGGPASSSHSSRTNIIQSQQKRSEWTEKLDFVFIDQRGTGCSSAYPSLADSSASVQRLKKYGSRFIVLDAEAVRKQLLGAKPWKVFGQSYGAQIVHRYVAEFPGSLISAHAHGGSIGTDGKNFFALRLASQQRVVREYLKRYPQDEEDLNSAVQQLSRETCVQATGKDHSYCGRRLVHNLIFLLGFSNEWPTLHEWISDLVDHGELNKRALQDLVDRLLVHDTTSVRADEAGTVINGMEYGESAYGRRECDQHFAVLKSSGHAPETWPLHECAIAMQYAVSEYPDSRIEAHREVYVDKDPVTLKSVEEALQTHPQLKFFLYSGEYDAFVPKETFAEEVKTLGHLIRYYHFPGSGHEGFSNEPRVWRDLVRGAD